MSMTNYNIDVLLRVEASGQFPFIFPAYLGPQATMTSSAAEWTADVSLAETMSTPVVLNLVTDIAASMPVTVSNTASATVAHYADSGLTVTIFPSFPYIFPFIFGQSVVTAELGFYFFTQTLAVTASNTATATRDAVVDATQAVTASLTATMFMAFEEYCDVTLGVTATPTATMSHGQPLDAPLVVTASRPTTVNAAFSSGATLSVATTTPETTAWHALFGAEMPVTVDRISQVGHANLVDVALVETIDTTAGFIHSFGTDVNLPVTAGLIAGVGQGTGIDANLEVRVILQVTLPAITGWWPFYRA